MQTIEIIGEMRVASGKGGARRSRAAGKTPGVLYGAGGENLSISLDTRQFERILSKHASGTFVLDVKLAGQEGQELNAIIKDLQRDPLSSRILHVDLLHVSLTQLIQIQVPIHLIGTPVGVKEGGILEHFTRSVDIECQAGQIPDGLSIDVSAINKGQMLHVSDLQPPEGVKILTPADRVVVGVVLPRAEVEVAPAAVVEGAPAAGEAAAAAAPADAKAGKEAPAAKGAKEAPAAKGSAKEAPPAKAGKEAPAKGGAPSKG